MCFGNYSGPHLQHPHGTTSGPPWPRTIVQWRLPSVWSNILMERQCFIYMSVSNCPGWCSSSLWTLRRGSRVQETRWTPWSCPVEPRSTASFTSASPSSWSRSVLGKLLYFWNTLLITYYLNFKVLFSLQYYCLSKSNILSNLSYFHVSVTQRVYKWNQMDPNGSIWFHLYSLRVKWTLIMMIQRRLGAPRNQNSWVPGISFQMVVPGLIIVNLGVLDGKKVENHWYRRTWHGHLFACFGCLMTLRCA